MKFFNIDCHISVIADVKNIFENLGHTVEQWSLSGHKWVFNLPECNSPVINQSNWTNINEELADKFYETHQKELDKFDAFIVAYPPCFLKLFEKFNKPIIVISATRYDHPFTDNPERIKWLNDSITNNKNLILVANNEFDKKYCEKFTNKEWNWIPSLCAYTNAKYKNLINKTIIFSKFQIQKNQDFIHQYEIGNYQWQDLYSFRNIIHFPYNISTMSIFEQYEAGVPLIFPSLKFSLDMINNGIPLFSEIMFPNRDSKKQKNLYLNEEWLKTSDFYNGTLKCHYFNSTKEISELTSKNLPNINKSNKDYVYVKWNQILNNI